MKPCLPITRGEEISAAHRRGAQQGPATGRRAAADPEPLP